MATLAAAAGSYQSAAPAPLKVPKRYQSFSSHSALLASPSPFGGSNSFIKSPFSSTPTPKPRVRPPDTPAWFSILFLHALPLYIAHAWLTTSSPSPPGLATTVTLAFLTLTGSSIGFTISQYHGNSNSSPASSTSLASALWILCSGIMVATSALLRIHGLRTCGPLVAILAEYAGSSLGKFTTKLTSTVPGRSFRGFLAIAAGLLLLQQGWSIESCSPLAIKVFFNPTGECSKVGGLPVWAPAASGLLSFLANSMAAKSLVKRNNSSRRRALGLANVAATLLLLPVAILQLESLVFMRASAWWPLANMVSLGISRSLHGETHFEEKLQMPHGSLRHFGITAASSCVLELWFGLDVSPAGFLVCACLIGFGVRSLPSISSAAAAAAFSWESIADREASIAFSAWVTGPLKHIYSNSKSRKIAVFLAMNTAFMFVEFIYGFTSNSLGLVSDACHMLFDCAALAIGLYASYISKLQPSGTFSYGYARFEVLSGYANAIFLVLVASLIVLESIERILDPPEVSTESILLVSVGGLLVNMVGLVFFHDEHHHAHGGSGSCSHAHHADHHHGEVLDVVETTNHVHLHGLHQQQHIQHGNEQNHYSSVDTCQHPDGEHHHGDLNGDLHIRQRFIANHDEQANHDKQGTDHHHHHHEDHHSGSGFHHQDNGNHDHRHSGHHHHEDNHSGSSFDHQDNGNHDHRHSGDHHHEDHGPGTGLQHHHHEKQEDYRHSGSGCEHHHHGHSHSENKYDVQRHSETGCEHEHHQQHHHHDKIDHNTEDHKIDHNMQGIFLHVLADTLGSVGVVISTLLIKYKGWTFSDAACSIFISVMIIASVIPLLKNSAEILLQRTPRSMDKRLQEALERVKNVPGLGGLERLHAWSLTNDEIIGSLRLHAVTGADKQLMRDQVSRILLQAGITDLTVQVEEMM